MKQNQPVAQRLTAIDPVNHLRQDARRTAIRFDKEEPAVFTAVSKAGLVIPAGTEWIQGARRIVAYPEDYGMTRRDVRGLERLLAARTALAAAPAVLGAGTG